MTLSRTERPFRLSADAVRSSRGLASWTRKPPFPPSPTTPPTQPLTHPAQRWSRRYRTKICCRSICSPWPALIDDDIASRHTALRGVSIRHLRQQDFGTRRVPASHRFGVTRQRSLRSSRVHSCVGTHKPPHSFDQIGTADHAVARASVIIQSLACRGPATRYPRAASQARPDCCRQDDHENSPR